MTSLMKRAKARDRSLRERYGKSYRRLRKNSPRAVFRLGDIYRDGVWWPRYVTGPKRITFKAPDGKEIKIPASCENWRDVADRLKKSAREFIAILRYCGRF